MDLNGDGIDDILYEYVNKYDPSKSDFKYILCNGLSFSQPVTFVTQKDDSHTGMTGKIRRNGISQEDDNERSYRNLVPPSLGKNNLSSMYPSKSKNIVDSDFNGDGINDVFINDPNGHCQIWYYKLGQMNKLTEVTFLNGILSSDVLSGDFNGDGLVDLWSFENTGLKIFNYDVGVYGGINLLYTSTWPQIIIFLHLVILMVTAKLIYSFMVIKIVMAQNMIGRIGKFNSQPVQVLRNTMCHRKRPI